MPRSGTWFRQGTLTAELEDIPRGAGGLWQWLCTDLAAPLFHSGKTREKTLLQKSVVTDRLQRLLQPKLLK